MNDPGRKTPSFAIGVVVVAIGSLSYAFVSGCGSGQEGPPTSPAQSQAQAESTPDHAGPHHRHVPPPAAFDACRSKAAGDACTVEMHDNEIAGKCETAPPGAAQTGLACRPEGGPRGRKHGPPPEIVFAACDSKAAGDACTVAFERGTVEGTCMAPRHDAGAERLLCAPAHRNAGGK